MRDFDKMTIEEIIQERMKVADPEIAALIHKEDEREAGVVELIASENFPSEAVKFAAASSFVAKYSEGYPALERTTGNRGRYYGGCFVVDEMEELCCNRWKQVFKTDYHVNVQPHSGSSANLAAYMSVLKPGDTILAMDLNNGGHLTHGSAANFSGKLFNMAFYNVDTNGFIDYDDVEKKANELKPALILAGASAYSRIIDFERFSAIAKSVGAYFMVDMAHIAGLVAGGVHPSPFGLADIITTTTHKTLRGTRGGLIFCREELAKKVDSAVFPCTQGGPLQHIIAAKAVAAAEACRPEFAQYAKAVVENTKAMCDEFIRLGYEIVTGGTDNHLFLVDLSNTHPHLTGKLVQDTLDANGITLNKNCVPNEKRKPMEASGVRIGCAAMTTKGYTAEDFVKVARRIDEIIRAIKA